MFRSKRQRKSQRRARRIGLLERLEDRRVLASNAVLLADIGLDSSDISELTTIGSTTYFVAATEDEGTELWKTDGTPGGTEMVSDINPGPGSSSPRELSDVDGTLFFVADDGQNGEELWKSDGTANGTEPVIDLAQGSASSSPKELTAIGNTLFFAANDGFSGEELWKTDGSQFGTEMVLDINNGGGSSIYALTNVDGTLFFGANDGSTGRELWKSDGTFSGTMLVSDINQGGQSSFLSRLTSFDGQLFFQAEDGSNGRELWKSDGTSLGTVMVRDINPNSSSFPRDLTVVGDSLFFSANDGTNGTELWKSDGSEQGTIIVSNIAAIGSSDPERLAPFGSLVAFAATDGVSGKELWVSDGSQDGTRRVADINDGAPGSYPSNLLEHDGKLFFSADNGSTGFELWESDGTTDGTKQVADWYIGTLSAYPYSLETLGESLLFSAADQHRASLLSLKGGALTNLTEGKELTFTLGSYPRQFTSAGTQTFFAADNGQTGSELWVTDGTRVGTRLLKDINPGPASAGPYYLTDVNGTLFFSANHPTLGNELFKSDGTPEGTELVKDINPSGDSLPFNLIAFNGELFFVADDGQNGFELWKSDGTADGTTLVRNITGDSNDSFPSYLTVVGDRLFFAASEGDDTELWKSDGTSGGTQLVKNINTDDSSYPYNFAVANNTLFFSADDGANGQELWKSDGTSDGTVLVRDINTDGDSYPQYLTPVGDNIFFSAFTEDEGNELWKSDGTSDGTQLVSNINAGGDSDPSYLASVGDAVLFAAEDGLTGIELWISDGSAQGTQQVADINPNNASSSPYNLTPIGDTLFFVAEDGQSGRELWESDGTDQGTRLVKDIKAGPDEAFVRYLSPVIGGLMFQAESDAHGSEPWFVAAGPASRFEVTVDFENIELLADGDDLVVRDGDTQDEVFRRPRKAVSGINIIGHEDDNTLNVLMDTFPSLEELPIGDDRAGIVFFGGDQTEGDTLRLSGNPVADTQVDSIIYRPADPTQPAGPGSGGISIGVDDTRRAIQFTGLEPLLVTTTSSDVVVDTGAIAGEVDATLTDDDNADDNVSLVQFPLLEVEDLVFTNPVDSFIFTGTSNHANRLTIEPVDAQFDANVNVSFGDADDTLIVNAEDGVPQMSVVLAAGTSEAEVNRLKLEGAPENRTSREIYIAGDNPGAGNWLLDPNDSFAMGNTPGELDGDEFGIRFSGVVQMETSIPTVTTEFVLSDGEDEFELQDANDLEGVSANLLNDAFGNRVFNRKETVRVHGMLGSDTGNVNVTTPADQLQELHVFGFATVELPSSIVGDDNVGDRLNIDQLPSSLTARVFGGGGSDALTIGRTNNSLDDVLGPIFIDGESGNDQLRIFDSAGGGDTKTIALSNSTIVGLTGENGDGAAVTYTGLDDGENDGTGSIDIQTSARANVLNIDSTADRLQHTRIEMGDANDQIIISGTGLSGSVGRTNEIVSPIELATGAGTDSLQINDENNGTPSTLHLAAGEIGGGDLGTPVVAGGIFGSGGIVRHDGDLDQLEISLGGTNIINVDATGLSTSDLNGALNIVGGFGSNEFNIQANGLDGGNETTDHSYRGQGANDVFNVLFDSDTELLVKSLQIVGNSNDANDFDRANLNLTKDSTTREFELQFDESGNGLAIGGLGSPISLIGVDVADIDGGGELDEVRLSGSADADVLTVAPIDSDAFLAFNQGTPFDGSGSFSSSVPGRLGGGSGPDVSLSGVGPFIVDGDDGADKLFVYGYSDSNVAAQSTLDPFGFGAGVVIPGVANAQHPASPTHARDNVLVAQNQIRFVDDLTSDSPADTRLPVAFDNLSVEQVIVNSGSETVGDTGIADDIEVLSTSSTPIKINGGDPGAGDDGDRLSVDFAGDVSVFADDATPSTLTVTSTGTSPVSFTSIERMLTGLSGNLNLIGDNNDAQRNQDDHFEIRGMDVDGVAGGQQEASVRINNSQPIHFSGITTIDVVGGDTSADDDNGSDQLDVFPFVDQQLLPWGIDINFDGNINEQGVAANVMRLHSPTSLQTNDIFHAELIGQQDSVVGLTIENTNIVDIHLFNTDYSPVAADTFDDTDMLRIESAPAENRTSSGNERGRSILSNAGTEASPHVEIADGDTLLLSIHTLTGLDGLEVNLMDQLDQWHFASDANDDNGLKQIDFRFDGGDGSEDGLRVELPASGAVQQAAGTGTVSGNDLNTIQFANIEGLELISSTADSSIAIHGSDNSDTIQLREADDDDNSTDENIGEIDLNGELGIRINPDGSNNNFAQVEVLGHDGDDEFSAFGITGVNIFINEADSEGSDTLRIAATGDLTVSLSDNTILDADRAATPNFTHQFIESLLLDLSDQQLVVEGGNGNQVVTVTPQGVDTAQITSPGEPVIGAMQVAGLEVDGDTSSANNGTADELTLIADDTPDQINIGFSQIEISGLLPVTYRHFETLTAQARGGDDQFNVNGAGADLRLQGGDDIDLLKLSGSGDTISFDNLLEVERLDLVGDGPNQLDVTHAAVVSNLNSSTDPIRIVTNSDETVNFDDGWDLVGTDIIEGVFYRRIVQDPATLLLKGPNDWQNPLIALDVDGSGLVSPADILAIVNELNNPVFSNGSRQLDDPLTLNPFPNRYFDVDGDGLVTPSDALRIVNFLNSGGAGEGEPAPNAMPAQTLAQESSDSRVADHGFPVTFVGPLPDDSDRSNDDEDDSKEDDRIQAIDEVFRDILRWK